MTTRQTKQQPSAWSARPDRSDRLPLCAVPRLLLAPLLLLALLLAVSAAVVQAQGPEVAIIQQTIDRMSVEERVGQLFLVTFSGSDTGPNSDIAQLIRDYRIGGVALSPAYGNFRNENDTPRRVAELTNTLQTLRLDANRANPVPLFIAVSQEGDGYPASVLRSGFTPLPAPMAVGATWREANSLAAGRIVGQELAAVGVNMLFGPSLDVLSQPGRYPSADLGLGVFGGDPYWVGRLGRAYIQGVHQGSIARVATIARHFPGAGVADRSPDEELATVDRAAADFKRLDLAPFLYVSNGPPNAAADTTDGLMTALVRYRALQGATSRPIGLDAQGLDALMNMPDLAAWRERGILVSDALGAPAVRKSYDPSLQTFNQKSIARDAFLAGNDVLYLGRFALNDAWPDQQANIKATIEFFREQYRTDKAFKERVDRSLRRILLLKRRMYTTFTSDSVLVDARAADERSGRDETTAGAIAREAVTLISPTRDELSGRLPRPAEGDQLLIITDARTRAECGDCPAQPLIPPTALQDLILRLYGPSGTGVVASDKVFSLTFADLKAYLTQNPPLPDERRREIDERLRGANWLIFGMLDTNTAQDPNADALRLFLRDRRDLFRDKRVVALAFGPPYYLDATEISKLTAYYAVYGKTPPALEAAVRAVFQEFVPTGASPVSVPGTNYDLAQVLDPDPARAIPLVVAGKGPGDKVQVGETVTVRAGPILDHNGRPVPDRTKVDFTFFYRAEAVFLRGQSVNTRDGIAEASVLVERPGQLEITATAGPASTAAPLILAAQGEGAITATPTTPPTATPVPTVTPLPTATLAPTVQARTVQASGARQPSNWAGLVMAVGIMLAMGAMGLVVQRGPVRTPTTGLRLVLLSLAWGLVGYVLALTVLGEGPSNGLWPRLTISALCALLPAVWFRWRR